MNISRLIQLNAQIDRVIELRYMDEEEESHALRNTAIGAGAIGTAGLYARGAKVMNDWGGPTRGAGVMNRTNDIRERIKAGARAIPGDIKNAGAIGGRVGDYASRLGGVAGEGLGGLKALLAKLKGVKFNSRTDRLIQLNAALSKAI